MPVIPRMMINAEYITSLVDELLIAAGLDDYTCRRTAETENGVTLEIRSRLTITDRLDHNQE